VPVARKIDIPVETVLISQMKQISASHGDHFFGGRESTVVAHDAAHQTGSQQHVGAFNQKHFRTLFARGQRRRTSGPAASHHDNFHENLPNLAEPVGVKRKSRFIGEPKMKLITNASRHGGKDTKKDKLNFVLSKFRVFVMNIFLDKMQRIHS
jgi:hypothetical protein